MFAIPKDADDDSKQSEGGGLSLCLCFSIPHFTAAAVSFSLLLPPGLSNFTTC